MAEFSFLGKFIYMSLKWLLKQFRISSVFRKDATDIVDKKICGSYINQNTIYQQLLIGLRFYKT